MTAQEYIQSELEKLREPIERQTVPEEQLVDAILAKVLSKKFRKVKADETTVQVATNAIKYAIEHNQPVTVSYLFGGNKLWRFDEAPEIDWAELFALMYFLKWMRTIASVSPHGAMLDFYSEDIAVELLNNVPRTEAEQYSVGFRKMIDWIKPYVPDGVTIRYRRYAEEYPKYEAYLAELEAGKQRVLDNNGGELPVLSDEQKAATELNVRLKPGQDDDPQWHRKVELIHKALEETVTMDRYFNDPSLVMACPTSYSGWVATGSTKRSFAKFWAAVGALEHAKDGGYNELVLTPKQLEAAKFDWEPVHFDGLDGKNFSKIRILR